MDFVFDRTADSRVVKCLTIVVDATHEAVAIETERAISGHGAIRVVERLALSRVCRRSFARPNEHWFTHLLHARTVIELWRREYNEELPKKALGELTPAAFAKQLADNAANIEPGL